MSRFKWFPNGLGGLEVFSELEKLGRLGELGELDGLEDLDELLALEGRKDFDELRTSRKVGDLCEGFGLLSCSTKCNT